MAVRTDPEEARNDGAPDTGKRSPYIAPPSVRGHRPKAQPWGRGDDTERKPVQRTVQPLLDRLAVKVGPEPEPVEPIQPPPPAESEPDSVVPPTPEVVEEETVLLRVPKAILSRIIEEIAMSQNNQQNQNAKNDTASAQAAGDNANAKVQANAENVQASVETPAGAAKVEVKVDAAPAAPSAKANKWKLIGSHAGAALVGAGLTVGGYFLNRHLRGGASA